MTLWSRKAKQKRAGEQSLTGFQCLHWVHAIWLGMNECSKGGMMVTDEEWSAERPGLMNMCGS